MKKIDRLIRALATRMAEIDGDISRSMYLAAPFGPHKHDPGDDGVDDRPPTGDDYELLWDAILDECNGLRDGVLEAALGPYVFRRKK